MTHQLTRIANRFSLKTLLIAALCLGIFVLFLTKISSSPQQKIQAVWYDNTWLYRQSLVINHAQVSGASSLTDFPILVSLSNTQLKSTGNGGYVGQTDGGDFVFASDSGTKYDHEIEKYDPVNGVLLAWVRIPTLSNSVDTTIYLYYGNAACANQWNTAAVWDSHYVAVWHFAEGIGATIADSKNGHYANLVASSHWITSGKIGNAYNFDGGADGAIVPAAGNAAFNLSAFTVESWVQPNSPAAWSAILYRGNGNTATIQFGRGDSSAGLVVDFGDGSTWHTLENTTALTNSAMNFYATTMDTTTDLQALFKNGDIASSNPSQTGDPSAYGSTYNLGLGIYGDSSGGRFSGIIDEVRLSNIARSRDWLKTEYNNQNAPDTFITPGAQETPTPSPTSTPAPTSAPTSTPTVTSTSGFAAALGSVKTGSTLPLIYFKFDEGQGSVVNNSIPNSPNATIYNATWTNNGQFNRALTFDGAASRVATSGYLFNQIDNWTLSAWIRPADFSTVDQFILYNGDDPSGYGFALNGGGGTNGRLMGIFGYIRWIDSGYNFPAANRWYHVVMVRSSGTVKFYVNGIQTPGTDSGSDPYAPNNYFEIGHQPGQPGRYFSGSIDEVKIYNYALIPEAIKTDYNRSSALSLGSNATNSGSTAPNTSASQNYCIPGDPTPCAPPVGEWNFEEGTGTTAYDTSGNNSHTVFGTGSSAPTWTSGKLGKSLSFNGAQYTKLSNTVNAGNNFTLSGWVKLKALPSSMAQIFRHRKAFRDLYIDINSTGHFNFSFYDASSTLHSVTSASTLNLNQWYFITATYDQAIIKIYLNGIQDTSTLSGTWSPDWTTPLEQNIGGNHYDNMDYVNGSIDNLKIYNYARTPGSDCLGLQQRRSDCLV